MIKSGNYWICGYHDRPVMIADEKDGQSPGTWYTSICKNDALWYKEA